jgi:predicted DsbA family dithiol-disulfide isomerase
MREYMSRFAASFGVEGMVRNPRTPNTRRALAMAEFARDNGKLTEFREKAMDAYFKEGKDIEDSIVLKDLASAAGLDQELALRAADDPDYLKKIDAIRTEYKKVGTGGIPTFVFGRERVEGCQQYEFLVAAALRAGARRK